MLTPFDSPKSLHWQQSLRAPIVRQLEIFGFTMQFLTFLLWDRLTGANRGKKRQRRAKWLVDRLMNLGPTFIKIGQSLSTRADLIPLEYIEQLTQLQDRVPEFNSQEAIRVIETELGQPLDNLFESFTVSPLACARLGQVHRVFEHPKVAEDFLPLIRACYEESKRSPLWQKLRLIIVQSTESYVSLRLEQSPFNVGLPIELQGFGQEQVAELAKKYQLNELATNEIQQLIDLVGGHPALIHLAIYHLSQEQITMPDLIKSATTSTGIYSSHLQLHWVTLQKQPELAAVFQQICQGNQPIIVDPIIAYKLNSMGLIKLRENQAIVSCQLYQKYFISQYTGSV